MSKTFLFFSAQYLPTMGGVERYTYNLAKTLTQRGHRVIIVTSAHSGAAAVEQSEEALIYRLPSLNLLDSRFPVAVYGGQARRVFREIAQKKVDYVVVNTRFYLLSWIGAAFGRRLGAPTIVIEHGTGHFTVNNPFFDFCGHIYEHIITGLVKLTRPRFYGVSRACTHWLEHFHIESQGVLYNAIDLPHIRSLRQGDQESLRQRIGYCDGDFIITYTGRLVREKGVEKLMEAFRRLLPEFPEMKLCIAGDGPLYEDLVKACGPRVCLLGKLPFSEVVQLLSMTRIYCLPTNYPEGLPTSVLEAIACGAYVITTASGGAKEVIADGSLGTILKENSPEEIARTIALLAREEAAMAAAAEKAYGRLCSRFTWEHTAASLLDAFQIPHQ